MANRIDVSRFLRKSTFVYAAAMSSLCGSAFAQQFKSFDESASKGKLTYSVDQHYINSLGRRHFLMTATETVLSPTVWTHSEHSTLNGLRQTDVSAMTDGKSWVTSDRINRTERIDDRPSQYDPSRERNNVEIVPGRPFLPLGRGLSRLKGLRKEGGVWVGQASDGMTWKATLGGTDNNLPQQIWRIRDNSIKWLWTFSGWHKQDGVWLPATTYVRLYRLGKPIDGVDATYTFRSFTRRTPTEKGIFADWYRRGYIVLDIRVAPAALFRRGELDLNTKLTLEDLLKLSARRSHEQQQQPEPDGY
jgi:hypothetical protein